MITLNLLAMGGNGSYSSAYGGIPEACREYSDSSFRIEGHKVLLLNDNVYHNSTPMNSNSVKPIYICGKADKKTKEISISTIAIYDKHKIVETIDLKFDKDGNFIPFGNKCGSHLHKWFEEPNGKMGRKSHDSNNEYPISSKYNDLISKIVEFNNKRKKWN